MGSGYSRPTPRYLEACRSRACAGSDLLVSFPLPGFDIGEVGTDAKALEGALAGAPAPAARPPDQRLQQ